jgi:hypothetical protein
MLRSVSAMRTVISVSRARRRRQPRVPRRPCGQQIADPLPATFARPAHCSRAGHHRAPSQQTERRRPWLKQAALARRFS